MPYLLVTPHPGGLCARLESERPLVLRKLMELQGHNSNLIPPSSMVGQHPSGIVLCRTDQVRWLIVITRGKLIIDQANPVSYKVRRFNRHPGV